MSNHLCDLAEGEKITFQGPLRRFHSASTSPRHRVHRYRNWSRAVPIHVLHWLLAEPDRHQGRDFWLLFGARHKHDIYYREGNSNS